MRKILLIFPLMIIFSSCTNKAIEQKEVTFASGFSHLYINDIFDIELVQDTINKVIFYAEEHLLSDLSAQTSGDTLTLSNKSKLQWMNNLERKELKLHFTDLSHIILNAPSMVYNTDTLKTNLLTFHCYSQMGDFDLTLHTKRLEFENSDTGGGTYVFAGKTQELKIFQRGTASVNAKALHAGQVVVKQDSFRACKVHANNQLQVTITRPSTVYYSGDPVLATTDIIEGGQLIRIEND